jgi:3-hydroxyacyl-[acyl-carrier-protein] dehydratase
MLQGNFFTIASIKTETQSAKAVLEINAAHEIFNGHFPGTPVVPGVCMMQMVKEILEDILAGETRMIKAEHIKFLNVINPQQTSSVNLDLKYSITDNKHASVIASLFNDEIVYFKFKGVFKPL